MHAPRAALRRRRESMVAPVPLPLATVTPPPENPHWARHHVPAIAPLLVDTAWTRAALDEMLVPFGGFLDVDTLRRRLMDAITGAPYTVDIAVRVLLEAGFPGPPPRISIPRAPLVVRPWRFDVPRYASAAELAASLDVTLDELDWFADLQGRLCRAPTPLRHYRALTIPKSAGAHRLLEIPKPRLREMQRRVLRRIVERIEPHDAAHGFRRGRGVHTFAAPHRQQDVVIRMDVRNFFPTITFARIRGVFAACGYPDAVAAVLAGICTTSLPVDEARPLPWREATDLRGRHLPQGAPTSPALANLVARGVDRRLAGLARARGLAYTRYADDLALSGPSSTDVRTVIGTVDRILRQEGFTPNEAKTRVRRSHRRQSMTGLVVNVSPQVPREEYDALRALLHNCRRTGAAAQNHDGVPDFRAYVLGRVAWVGESNDTRRRRLLALADEVDWAS
ncbi:reverse transcriptase family protein [Rhodococcoides corynebacterioides]|uniref:reverse transcriptase family protein n=1 Tax=Rhodococcoides corynebacterioides TaxID=53972 RepID=UPI001C9B5FAF|nr:reverse transcriptase family protein [Rhodococcus corynebacterioides]MBY6362638.1 RNA-directed DNA polymerase [Rhodococcus corynebacterioides]